VNGTARIVREHGSGVYCDFSNRVFAGNEGHSPIRATSFAGREGAIAQILIPSCGGGH
jgi:hypothetical protein